MRIDIAISETIGDRFFSGHLSFVEKRRNGIFFEAHDEIENHRDVCSLFGDEDEPWTVDRVAALRPSFARGLDFVLTYAERQEETLEDALSFASKRVDEKMGAYSEYYHEQTMRLFSAKVHLVAI